MIEPKSAIVVQKENGKISVMSEFYFELTFLSTEPIYWLKHI
jgi:hypothetical protein